MAAPVTPIRQRTQYTCGAASLSMALKALGCTLCSEDEVNKVMGAAPMQGASWEQIAAAANHYGCRSTLVVPSTLAQVRQWTDAGKPVLIGWNPEGRPWSHASLVFDVTESFVFVADPNCPDPSQTVREVSHTDFYGKWAEEWNGYKVRRPAMVIDREIDGDGRQVMASRRKASILTQPLMMRHDYGQIHDLSENTSRLPEDVAITANEDTMHGHDHHGDSDGSYMSVGYLKSLADKSQELLGHIHHDTPLPDWVEAKIGQAANAINSVRDYFAYRGQEQQTEDEGTMSLEDTYTMLPRAMTANVEPMLARHEEGKEMSMAEVTKGMTPEGKKKFLEEHEKNKDKFTATASAKVAVNLPADVERYVKEIEKKNPDYDEAQTWATAWSIYCKYKNPSSDHCQMPTSEYFKQAGSTLTASWGTVLAGDKTTMADWYEGHVIDPAISGPNTPPTDEGWGSDTPDGDGNKTKRAADGDEKDGKEAKFEEGVPADPTQNMSAEDKAKWEKQKEEHADEFKKSARVRLTAGEESPLVAYETATKKASAPSTVQGWLEWEG